MAAERRKVFDPSGNRGPGNNSDELVTPELVRRTRHKADGLRRKALELQQESARNLRAALALEQQAAIMNGRLPIDLRVPIE